MLSKHHITSAQRGAALVEYALLVGLIAVVGIGSVISTGTTVRDIFLDTSATTNTEAAQAMNATIAFAPPFGTPTQGASVLLPDGSVGTPYSLSLDPFVDVDRGAGIAPTWSMSAGSLPDGISLSDNGVLAGTPTTLGTSSFTLRAEMPNGASADQLFEFSVVPDLVEETVDLNDYIGSAALGYVGERSVTSEQERQDIARDTCIGLFGNPNGFTELVNYDSSSRGAGQYGSFSLYRIVSGSVQHHDSVPPYQFAFTLNSVTCLYEDT